MQALLRIVIYVAMIRSEIIITILGVCAIAAIALLVKADDAEGQTKPRWPAPVALFLICGVAASAFVHPILAFGGILLAAALASAGLNEFGYPRGVVAVIVWSAGCVVGTIWLAARDYVESLNLFI